MKAVGASGEGIERELRVERGNGFECGGARNGTAEMTKRHILVKSCWAIRQFVLSTTLTPPPRSGSGLFVLPCKCISLNMSFQHLSPPLAPAASQTSLQLFTTFAAKLYCLPDNSRFFACYSLLLVFVHRNNLSFLFYFVANFAWQRGRCCLCRECYVKGNFLQWILLKV